MVNTIRNLQAQVVALQNRPRTTVQRFEFTEEQLGTFVDGVSHAQRTEAKEERFIAGRNIVITIAPASKPTSRTTSLLLESRTTRALKPRPPSQADKTTHVSFSRGWKFSSTSNPTVTVSLENGSW